MENVDLARVRARDRLVALNALKLALERAVMVEGASMHDFGRAVKTRCASRQPHFAISATTDESQQFVVRNGRTGVSPVGFSCIP